jgi:hypothetical protein
MQMKHLILLFLATTISYSQTISKKVIGTAGKTQSNSNLKVSWTLGEPVVGLITASGRNQIANGFYPALNLRVLSLEDNSMEAQIKVFPNPTSQFLYVSHPVLNSFGIQIIDLNGKQVYSGTLNKEQPLDVSNYSQGMYLVTIENKETNKKNTYNIIKK